MNVVDQALIIKHQGILNSESEHYFKQDSVDNLKKLYFLFKRIDKGFVPLLEVMKNHIVHVGMTAIENLGKDAKVRCRLEFKSDLTIFQ